mgnify:CR=1 FL=1
MSVWGGLFALLAAIYLSEFAPDRVRKTVKPALEVLLQLGEKTP